MLEVDGELARLQAKESEFGAWLDLTLDRILDALVILGIVWPLTKTSVDLYLFTVLSITLVSTSSYVGLLYDRWMRVELGRTIYFRIGRDTRNLVIFGCAIFSLREGALWIIGALSLFETGRRLYICFRHGRPSLIQPEPIRSLMGGE